MGSTTNNTVGIQMMASNMATMQEMISKSLAPAFEAQASLQRILNMYLSTFESIVKPVKSLLGITEQPKTLTPTADKPGLLSFEILRPRIEFPEVEIEPHPFWIKGIDGQSSEPVVNLPRSASWENIRIQFQDNFDISVYYKNKFVATYRHDTLGLVRSNTKDKDPDVQWKLLQQLAIIYSSPKVNPTIQVLTIPLKISEESCQQAKRKLGNKLRAAFGIEDDPFLDYLPETGYQVKFKLLPEQIFRDNGDLRKQGVEYSEDMGADETI